MSFEIPGKNQRKSFRCTTADSCQQCVLRVGDRTLTAKLLDQSAGGFAILVDELAGLEADQTAVLCTNAGAFVVRAVHITKVVPTDRNVAAGQEKPCFRLGLVRLSETGLPEEPKTSILVGRLPVHAGQLNSPSRILLILGVLMILVLLATKPLDVISGVWHALQFGSNVMQNKDQQAESHSQESLPKQLRSTTGDSPFPVQGLGVPEKGSAFGNNHGRAAPSAFSNTTVSRYLRMPGATPLILPEVIEKLQLTPDQQSQIRDLTETTSKAMRNLDEKLRGQQRQSIKEQREKLLDQSRQEALKILSKEQRAQWDAMTAKPQ